MASVKPVHEGVCGPDPADGQLTASGRESAMKRSKPIRQEDLSRALKTFLENGGIIRQLPSSATPRLAVVGARHGQFENPREQLFGGHGYFTG